MLKQLKHAKTSNFKIKIDQTHQKNQDFHKHLTDIGTFPLQWTLQCQLRGTSPVPWFISLDQGGESLESL